LSTNTDVLVFHGATDAPTVDVQAVSVATIVDDISYGEFDGYLELPTAVYVLNVTDASGATVVASYLAPLSTLNLDGEAIVVLASGFLDPSVNSNGEGFGLWVALTSGGALIPLPISTSVNEMAASSVQVYPNPAVDQLSINLSSDVAENTIVEILDMTGALVATFASNGHSRMDVNVSSLASGSYMVRLVNNQEVQTIKFQVVK
jgi:hypothetical protein